MASIRHFLFWLCAVHVCISVTNEVTPTAKPLAVQDLTCNHKFRVVITRDTWTVPIGGKKAPRDYLQESLFDSILEEIVMGAKAKGVDCAFGESNHELICCDAENPVQFHPGEKKKSAPFTMSWSYIFVNILIVFVNFYFLFQL